MRTRSGLATVAAAILLASCAEAICDCAGSNPDLIVTFVDPLLAPATATVCLIRGPCVTSEVREEGTEAWFTFDPDAVDHDLTDHLGTAAIEVFADDGSRLGNAAISASRTESCCGDYWQASIDL